eukprot:m.176805 g.176805  ORF g.176805 m.176805 type:complete len:345 (+) comp24460_c0_seq1:631-1665(+)
MPRRSRVVAPAQLEGGLHKRSVNAHRGCELKRASTADVEQKKRPGSRVVDDLGVCGGWCGDNVLASVRTERRRRHRVDDLRVGYPRGQAGPVSLLRHEKVIDSGGVIVVDRPAPRCDVGRETVPVGVTRGGEWCQPEHLAVATRPTHRALALSRHTSASADTIEAAVSVSPAPGWEDGRHRGHRGRWRRRWKWREPPLHVERPVNVGLERGGHIGGCEREGDHRGRIERERSAVGAVGAPVTCERHAVGDRSSAQVQLERGPTDWWERPWTGTAVDSTVPIDTPEPIGARQTARRCLRQSTLRASRQHNRNHSRASGKHPAWDVDNTRGEVRTCDDGNDQMFMQ